jgi:hypothetical protein
LKEHRFREIFSAVLSKERPIAKNQNTFAKRQREMEKRAKAEAKRTRKIRRKQGLEEAPEYQPPDRDASDDADGPTDDD